MKKSLKILFLSLYFNFNLFCASAKDFGLPHPKNLDELVQLLARYSFLCSQQEFFPENKSKHPIKALKLKRSNDVRLVNILHSNAAKLNLLPIGFPLNSIAFGFGEFNLYSNNSWYGKGIGLCYDKLFGCEYLYVNPSLVKFQDFDLILQGYLKAVSLLRARWEFSSVKDYPNLKYYKNEESYFLLTKFQEDNHEFLFLDSFLDLVIRKLNIDKIVSNVGILTDSANLLGSSSMVYIWVEKSAFPQFQSIMNFEILD